ncbi:MAG: MerR family transcriptional regulator [Cellulosilyticaceae bacterium]
MMQINEVIKQVDLSRRAVKYYEEAGLLEVDKGENGYRNYSEEDVRILKEIAIYRKLGISIKDIKILLGGQNKQLLETIYHEKRSQLEEANHEVEALKQFIEKHDVEKFYEGLDYKTIGRAIQEMIPGVYGYFFMNHFMPYLQIQIETPEQQEAYEHIIAFWDGVNIKIPLVMRLSSYLMSKLPKPSLEQMATRMEAQLRKYLNATEEEYEALKRQTKQGVRMQNSLFYKYHPAFIAKRKFMKSLQDCGYNDIFIPNMIVLSPHYKAYHEALTQMNHRICKDLGLYYDSQYNLIMKKADKAH